MGRGYIEDMIGLLMNYLRGNSLKNNEEHDFKLVKITEAFDTGYTVQEIKSYMPLITDEPISSYMKYLIEKLEWYEMIYKNTESDTSEEKGH